MFFFVFFLRIEVLCGILVSVVCVNQPRYGDDAFRYTKNLCSDESLFWTVEMVFGMGGVESTRKVPQKCWGVIDV